MKERPNLASEPYYRCLSCHMFRNGCGGRPTRDYDLKTWCEYMHDVKEAFHLTNAGIAKEAEVSIKTIERIMAINIDQDIMRATARRIELAVIGPVGERTCCLDNNNSSANEQINKLLVEIEYWRKEDERKAKIIDKYLEGK